MSQATISMALRGDPSIPQETRERVRLLAKKHGYQSDPALSTVMAQTRKFSTASSNLALFMGVSPARFQEVEPYHQLVFGVEARCRELGYVLDRFWFFDNTITPERHASILAARGILGFIVLWEKGEAIPDSFQPLYNKFACAVIGTRPAAPPLNVSMPDHFKIGALAFERALQLGFRRPAALIYPPHDETTDYRLSLGSIAAQKKFKISDPIPPLLCSYLDPEVLLWLDKYRPDFLLVTEEQIQDHFQGMPKYRDLPLYHWDITSHLRQKLAGIHQNAQMIGAAGVDLVVGQIHRRERGVPRIQKCMLIEGAICEIDPIPAADQATKK